MATTGPDRLDHGLNGPVRSGLRPHNKPNHNRLIKDRKTGLTTGMGRSLVWTGPFSKWGTDKEPLFFSHWSRLKTTCKENWTISLKLCENSIWLFLMFFMFFEGKTRIFSIWMWNLSRSVRGHIRILPQKCCNECDLHSRRLLRKIASLSFFFHTVSNLSQFSNSIRFKLSFSRSRVVVYGLSCLDTSWGKEYSWNLCTV